MPVVERSEEAMETIIQNMAPRLVYLLEERRVPRAVIAAIGHDEMLTIAQFAKAGRNEDGFYAWLEEDLGIKVSDQGGRSLQARLADARDAAARHKEEAEAVDSKTRAMGLKPELQKGEQIELRRRYRELHGDIDDDEYPSYSYVNTRLEELEEGEIVAEKLSDVTTRQMELRQTPGHLGDITWSKRGEPVLRKHRIQGRLPTSTEEYRQLYRVMRYHWDIVRLRHGNRPMMKDLDDAFWTRHVEYMLGKEVHGYAVRDDNDDVIVKLSWIDFLKYDYEVRKRAVKRVNEMGATLGAAMIEARTNDELRTKFIVQRIAVSHLVPSSSHEPMPKGRGEKRPWGQEDGRATPRNRDEKGTGSKGSGNKGTGNKGQGKKSKKGGKSKGRDNDDPAWKRLQLARQKTKRGARPPDGKGDCWDYNLPHGCHKADCPFHHLCVYCGRSHSLVNCPEYEADQRKG